MEKKKINSKRKGKRFELELAHRLTEFGYSARRTAQYCGNTGDASDVVGLPGLHIEAKRSEQFRIYDWMAQAKHDAAQNKEKPLPAVFCRKSNSEILVTMELTDFMAIYKAWELEREI